MGFLDKLKNAWKIFKLSFSLLSRDKSLIVVPILIIFSMILACWPLITVFVLHLNGIDTSTFFPAGSKATLFLFIFIFLFYFLYYFWIVFLASAQVWMVYEVLQGKDTTVGFGFKRAILNFFDILLFTFSFIIINILLFQLRRTGKIGDTVGGVIGYLSTIVGRLVLPAMIITERNFKDSLIQIKDSIKAIPEIATYEIGIRPLASLTFWIGILICFVIGVLLGFYAGVITLIILILLVISFSVYINNTYYTILYLTLIEKKKIKNLQISA